MPLANDALNNYLQGLTTNAGPLNAPTTGLIPQSYTQPTSPLDTSNLGVIQQSLPAAVNSFQTKYANNNPLSQSLSSPVYNALQAYDAIRLQKGQAPLSQSITGDVAQAAETGQSVAPAPEPSLTDVPGNVFNDFRQMIGAIPSIPGQIVHDLQHAYEIPDKLKQIQTQSNGDVRQQLGGLLHLPLVNLIPGTYTAGNIAEGNYSEIAKHPLMTALDVLPYANKLAKATPVFKAAEEANIANAAEQSALHGFPVEAKTNPIKTILTKKLTSEGEVVPNTLGSTINKAVDQVANNTTAGQLMRDAWSPEARLGARTYFDQNEAFRNNMNPEGRPSNDPVVQWNRDVNELKTKFKVDDTERAAIDRGLFDPVNNPIDQNTLSPDGLAYQDAIRDLDARSKILDQEGEIQSREWQGKQEQFSKPEAARLDRINRYTDNYQKGFDARMAAESRLADWRNPNLHEVTPEPMNLLGKDVQPPTNTTMSSVNIEAAKSLLQPIKRNEPIARDFMNSYNAGDYISARRAFKKMKGAKWDGILGDVNRDGVLSEFDEGINATKELNQNKRFTKKGLDTRLARAEQVRNSITPARFSAMRDEVLKSNLRTVVGGLDDPNVQQYLQYIDNNDIKSLVQHSDINSNDVNSALREAQQTVAQMAAEGADPVFLHHVTPQAAEGLKFPQLSEVKLTPSSTKSRGLDLTPYVPDFQVAMSHQGMEFLRRSGAEHLVDTLSNAMGKSYSDLRAQYLDKAMEIKSTRNPDLNIDEYIDKQIKKSGYTRFDTDAITPWKKKSTAPLAALEDTYIPTEVANNMKRLVNGPGKITAAFDPVMKAFRTSVLPLSPRWLVNNMFGGLFNLLMERSPRALLELPEAFKLARSGELENIPGLKGHGAMDISPEEMAQFIEPARRLTGENRLAAVERYKQGQFLRRMIEDNPATSIFKKTIAGSYKVNQIFDDMYRGMAYLDEKKSALKKGLTEEEAQARGVAIGRRILQNWDELTPLERTSLRFAFPFYGFMQHMMRFVTRYPFDHPVRTSIIGSFARNELNDMGTGLPEQFMSMMRLGSPDEQGNQKAINLSGANPFAVTADSFTLAGLMGQSNPVSASIAETLGLDPISQTADLYPNVTYNPETGKLEAAQGNFLGNLASNTLPLTGAVGSLLPGNKENEQLLATNPEAYGRQLFAKAGIPMLMRNINIPTEIIKAEKNRIANQQTVKSQAVKTGDYSEAERYPALQAWMQQLALSEKSGDLSQYRPIAPQQVANPATSLLQAFQGSQRPTQAAYQNQQISLGG